ncbi:MAG: DUF2796 domain-containing protein [Xanthomonadaceae bacterium]|jgi:hypothetical protein|nr:DUF2796 domain-containing protein [Xanthomonadaceae bacterium]
MSAPSRSLLFAALIVALPAFAHDHDKDHAHDDGHREHGAHVHGVAWLDVALDGARLEIAFKGTGADLAGLEGRPADAADVAKVDKARRTLADAAALFAFEPAGACVPDGAPVVEPPASALEAPAAAGHDHDHKHDHDHDHDHKHDHAHGDWSASYAFACATPPVAVNLPLFDRYPDLTEVRAQILTGSGQTAAEATPASRRIPLAITP